MGGTGGTVCKAVSICVPGWRMAREPTVDADRACVPCTYGTFSVLPNQESCISWRSSCSPGEYDPALTLGIGSTSTEDRECRACNNNTFTAYSGASRCRKHSKCRSDEYVIAYPTPSSDVVCSRCTQCAPGEYPTNVTDAGVLCAELGQCHPCDGSQESGPPGAEELCALSEPAAVVKSSDDSSSVYIGAGVAVGVIVMMGLLFRRHHSLSQRDFRRSSFREE